MLIIPESSTSFKGVNEPPSVEDFICLLQECRKTKSLASTKLAHVRIHDNGLEAYSALGNHLLPMLVECGSLPQAQQVFHRLVHRDEYSWTSMIQGYIGCGELQRGLGLFQEMQKDCVQPSRYTVVALLKACSGLKCVDRGREIHIEIVKEELEKNVHVGNTLVDMYAKCGFLVEAQEVFDELGDRDLVSWTALIAGYAEHGLGEEALKCLEQMQLEGVSMDAVTFVCSLKACGSIGAIHRGQEIHAKVIKEGLENNCYVGSTLIDMYAKHGSLAEAQKVFDKLSVWDVVSWTVLISGYAEHRFVEEALSCMKHMQMEGVCLDAVVFMCCLKACSSIGAIDTGRDMHSKIAKEGFEDDPSIGNTLVDMYAKCGFLAEAQEVFEALPLPDVISWNALIAGYAEHGFLEETRRCFEQMQQEGVSPDAITFICSLKACGTAERGLEIHSKVTEEGFQESLSVGNTLVDMYADFGLLLEAQEVFDELLVQDVFSWTALIAGYAEHGFGEEALKCLEEMQLEGVSPNTATFVCSLNACENLGAINKRQEIYTQIVKQGFEGNPLIGSILVDMYVEGGSLLEAQQVFDELPACDVVAWTKLMAGYVEHGLDEEVFNCLQQMLLEGVFPDAVTYVFMLKACGSKRTLSKGRELHAEIVKEGFENDPFVGNTLLDMYAKCGSLAEAQEVFDDLPVQSIISWSALMAGYAEHGLGEEVLNCLALMHVEDVCMDSVTFVCSLKACGNIGLLEKGRLIHIEVAKEGYECFPCVGNTLVAMYAKCASLSEAREVFEELLVRDVVSWNALIAGYVENSLAEEAFICLEEMQLDGVFPDVISWSALISGYSEQGVVVKACLLLAQMQEHGLLPNYVTFVSILKACGNTAALQTGNKICAQLYRAVSFEAEVILATALLDMYGKCGNMFEAEQVFDDMPTKDLVGWNALIAGYTRQGENKQVFGSLERMREEGTKPNGITFLCILTACAHAGLVDMGHKLFEAMSREHGITPSIKHHNCMVDLLGRAGQLDEAMVMLEKMPCQPDPVAWSTVLAACQKLGYIDLARDAVNSILKVGESHVASFVLATSIYEDAYMCAED